MSSNEFAIRVTDISKFYEVYSSPRDRLKQFFFRFFVRFSGAEKDSTTNNIGRSIMFPSKSRKGRRLALLEGMVRANLHYFRSYAERFIRLPDR